MFNMTLEQELHSHTYTYNGFTHTRTHTHIHNEIRGETTAIMVHGLNQNWFQEVLLYNIQSGFVKKLVAHVL